MDVCIARQPIFNINMEVYGYEILYREGNENLFPSINGENASSSVLTSCFIDFGINDVTNNKKAFINFTGELLKNNIASIFPKDYLVVEILESVVIDQSIIESCKILKEKGYMLAIDDFEYQEGYEELINIVDIIKVDFVISSEYERGEIVKKYKREGLEFLAEKVETYEEYRKAIEMGYTYFQGYYFSKPEIGSRKKVVPYKENHLKLINTLNSKEPEFREIAKTIENDLAFSYEVLRLVNSAYFNRKNKIMSTRHAIVTLGIGELKKWLYLALMRDLKQDKPEEIVNSCMLRGKFLENIAIKTNKNGLASEMMTLGMFSMIDILMNKDIEEALKEINFSDSIKCILTHNITEGFMADSFQIVLKYEKGQWDEVEKIIGKIDISISQLNEAYMEAIKWVQQIKTI